MPRRPSKKVGPASRFRRFGKAPQGIKKVYRDKSGKLVVYRPLGFFTTPSKLEELFAGSDPIWRPLNIRKKK